MGFQIGGLIGLFGGVIFGLIGWYIGRNKAKRERALDETHEHIWLRARSYSWYATIIAIYTFFTLHLVGIEMSIAMILALLILVQLSSWGISGVILSVKIYSESEKTSSNTILGYVIIIVTSVLGTILLVLTKNWVYLLLIILFGIVGTFIILKQKEGSS